MTARRLAWMTVRALAQVPVLEVAQVVPAVRQQETHARSVAIIVPTHVLESA